MRLEHVNAITEAPPQSTRTHVLTLTPFYPHNSNDVAGCFVAEPLKSMEALGIVSSVCAVQSVYHDRNHAIAEYPAQWSRYIGLPGGLGLSSAGAFLFARLLSQARRIHRRFPISLIHAHAALPCGHAAMLLAQRLNVPFVLTVHGLDAYSTKQVRGRAGDWCLKVSRQVFRSASRVICISECVRGKVLEHVNGECLTSVIYNGVDTHRFAPADEAGCLKVLSVGNLIPIKGHDLLLRAVALVRRRIPEVTCEIIGEGPELPALQSLAARLSIREWVHFAGRRTRGQVAQALRDCTIFALPSRYEALGCVYLEAMSAARPVIACRGQGIGNVIEHGKDGWLVGTDDPEELADSLTILLEDAELRKRIRLAGRRKILHGFTLEHQAQQLNSLYRECVA